MASRIPSFTLAAALAAIAAPAYADHHPEASPGQPAHTHSADCPCLEAACAELMRKSAPTEGKEKRKVEPPRRDRYQPFDDTYPRDESLG